MPEFQPGQSIAQLLSKFTYELVDVESLMWGGRGRPEVACWAYDHWVAGSNPLRVIFCH